MTCKRSRLTSLAYDGLVGYRRVSGAAGATLVGALATDAPRPSHDGLTYVFTLRRGLRYSDGRPVRPEDFRASMERFLQVTRAPIHAVVRGHRRSAAVREPAALAVICPRGIETDPRARTITIHLTRPDGDFLHKLTQPFAFVVPSDTPRHLTGDHAPPGTGPYRFASLERATGAERLVRNPYFRSRSPRARPTGFADRIEVEVRGRRKRDIEKQIEDVQRGTADVTVLADPLRRPRPRPSASGSSPLSRRASSTACRRPSPTGCSSTSAGARSTRSASAAR